MVTKRTPIHAAAGQGHVECVTIMLKNITNTSHIDCVDVYGRCVCVCVCVCIPKNLVRIELDDLVIGK